MNSNISRYSTPFFRSCQLPTSYRNYKFDQNNIERIFQDSPARYTIFPEASSTGFPYDELDLVTTLNKDLTERIQEMARSLKKGAILPLLMKYNDSFVNRIQVVSWSGEIAGFYDKVHLIGALNENKYLVPGKKSLVLDLDFPPETNIPPLRTGFATCYDLRFPELFRKMVLEEKAEMILLPAFWPMARARHFYFLQIARAIENQVNLLSANTSGRWGRLDLCGGSMAINAKGEVVSSLSETETGFIDFTPDLEETRNWRSEFPALKDSGKEF